MPEPLDTTADLERIPVAKVQQLLLALQDPVRLEMVRRLTNAGGEARCSTLYDGINKSTAAHHFKILREAGITERVTIDGNVCQKLRSEDVDAAVPGLLAAVTAAANSESNVSDGLRELA